MRRVHISKARCETTRASAPPDPMRAFAMAALRGRVWARECVRRRRRRRRRDVSRASSMDAPRRRWATASCTRGASDHPCATRSFSGDSGGVGGGAKPWCAASAHALWRAREAWEEHQVTLLRRASAPPRPAARRASTPPQRCRLAPAARAPRQRAATPRARAAPKPGSPAEHTSRGDRDNVRHAREAREGGSNLQHADWGGRGARPWGRAREDGDANHLQQALRHQQRPPRVVEALRGWGKGKKPTQWGARQADRRAPRRPLKRARRDTRLVEGCVLHHLGCARRPHSARQADAADVLQLLAVRPRVSAPPRGGPRGRVSRRARSVAGGGARSARPHTCTRAASATPGRTARRGTRLLRGPGRWVGGGVKNRVTTFAPQRSAPPRLRTGSRQPHLRRRRGRGVRQAARARREGAWNGRSAPAREARQAPTRW